MAVFQAVRKLKDLERIKSTSKDLRNSRSGKSQDVLAWQYLFRKNRISESKEIISGSAQLLSKALSKWDGEGGAGPGHAALAPSEGASDVPLLANAELVQLQTRVIALENLVIALLADASDRQTQLAQYAAANIRPRPGHTLRPLTIKAAGHMLHLLPRGEVLGLNMDIEAP